jgi:hypothetical protein
MSDAPDRSGAVQPHRADHFDEAAQIARMGAVFRGRRQDELGGVRDDYDQDYGD